MKAEKAAFARRKTAPDLDEESGSVQTSGQTLKKQTDSTEERILDAAFDVLQERTLGGTRMAMIAERAGLFQSNIHYYYKSKRALLLAVQEKVLNRCIELRENLRVQGATAPEDCLACFWGQKKHFILAEPRYDYAEIDFWTQARVDDEMCALMRRSFAHWRGEIEEMLKGCAPGLPPARRKLLAGVMVSLMEGASMQYLIDPEAFDLDAYFDYCTALVRKELEA